MSQETENMRVQRFVSNYRKTGKAAPYLPGRLVMVPCPYCDGSGIRNAHRFHGEITCNYCDTFTVDDAVIRGLIY